MLDLLGQMSFAECYVGFHLPTSLLASNYRQLQTTTDRTQTTTRLLRIKTSVELTIFHKNQTLDIVECF